MARRMVPLRAHREGEGVGITSEFLEQSDLEQRE